MLVWLDGDRQRARRPERELRARDDGAVHARRRPRRLQRAATCASWRARSPAGAPTGSTSSAWTTSATTPRATTTATRPCSGRPATTTGSDACDLCVAPPAAPVVLRQQAVGLLRPDAAVAATAGRARRRCTCRAATRSAGRRGDPAAPGPPRRAAHGEAAGRLQRRAAARARSARSTRRMGLAVATGAGQHLFYPPNVSGWDDTRWLDTATVAGAASSSTRRVDRPRSSAGDAATLRRDRDARRRRVAARARLLGQPGLTGETLALLAPSRAGVLRRIAADWQRARTARCARTRCAC